jgi:hypothetical protein
VQFHLRNVNDEVLDVSARILLDAHKDECLGLKRAIRLVA